LKVYVLLALQIAIFKPPVDVYWAYEKYNSAKNAENIAKATIHYSFLVAASNRQYLSGY
jgi:hypothetical protein